MLRGALGLLGASAAAWIGWWVARGAIVAALLGALGILTIHVPIMALEFMLMHAINRADSAPRASLAQVFGAWLAEGWAFVRPFAWDLPMWCAAEPDHLQPHHAGRRGIVLVHGLLCNRALWNPWMRRLHELDVPFVAVNLEPPFAELDRQADAMDDALERLRLGTGMAPLLVCHSMGGLVARAWLRKHGSDAVHRVLTIGTPHGGTSLGRGLRALIGVPAARQAMAGSTWLRALADAEPARLRARFICFYSHCDNVVMPASRASLVGADNRHVPGCAHTQMLRAPQVWQTMLACLAREAPR